MNGETEIYEDALFPDYDDSWEIMREADKIAIFIDGNNECYWPTCKREMLVRCEGHNVLDGEKSHIESNSPQGPRYKKGMNKKDYDSPANLLLFCKPHHQIVDIIELDDFPPERVRRMKKDHEDKVKRLNRPPARIKDIENRISGFQVIM